MAASQRVSPHARALIAGACFVIVLAGMRVAADLVNAFLLAMVITVSVSPFLHWLTRHGIPEKVAATIMIILVLAIVAVLLITVFLSASQLVEMFPLYKTRVGELITDLERRLRARGLDLTETLEVEPLGSEQLIDGAVKALIVTAGYSVIKGVVFSVLKPIVAGKKLNLSRLAIIVSVVLWVWVLGPIGAMLAVPVTMIVKDVLLESSEEGRVLALVMSADAGTPSTPSDESTAEAAT